MQRISENEVSLTNKEIEDIREFIWNTLYNDWDRWTDICISRKSLEEGMRSMNSEMYDFMEKLNVV